MAARTTLELGEKADGICLGSRWTALPTSGDSNNLIIPFKDEGRIAPVPVSPLRHLAVSHESGRARRI